MLLIGAVVVLLLGAGGFLVVSQMNKSSTPGSLLMDEKKVVEPTSMVGEQNSEGSKAGEMNDTGETVKQISLSEIEKHANPTDCWFAVNGDVYDVTKYIAGGKHPGEDAILEGCGKDATVLFTTRPMGPGTPHSEKATNFLQTFKIGVLAN